MTNGLFGSLCASHSPSGEHARPASAISVAALYLRVLFL